MTLWKLGCRWGSNTPLFFDFIKEHKVVITWIDKTFKKNDWILIADGHTVLAFAKVLENPTSSLLKPNYREDFEELQIPFSDNLLVAEAKWIVLKDSDQFKYQLQQGICKVQDATTKSIFKKTLKQYTMQLHLESLIKLLKHKKQIILQGPPGTGKTRLAKEIASQITSSNVTEDKETNEPAFLSNKYIKSRLQNVQTINSSTGRTQYKLSNILDDRCTVMLTSGTSYDIPYEGVKRAYGEKLWLGGQKNGYDSYDAAIAKYLYENLDDTTKHLTIDKAPNEYSIVQFHPSYTYEDFVRGITVKNVGNNIEYKTENKIFGKLIKEANDNYVKSQQPINENLRQKWVEDKLTSFVESIQQNIDDHGKYPLNENVSIIEIDEDAFRYTGKEWASLGSHRMRFSDIITAFLTNVSSRQDIKNHNNMSRSSFQHATYYYILFEKFKNFVNEPIPERFSDVQTTKIKDYVLIIDEINRANLPSVLGELIYALEYRGEKVPSMYHIEGNDLIIPPNLYIIGTMNTADRSVGHIDYAIRRRFAFVDVLPDESVIGNETAKQMFIEIRKLFESKDTLASDFKPEQVQLGHSYFLVDNDEELKLRAKYEIIPILEEYLKDGILLEKAQKEIIDLKERFAN